MSPRAAGGDGRGSRRRHPTIVDVAERAGVSKSLVSLVLRNAPNVSDEKRAAVTKAAEEIGYRPNAVAHILLTPKYPAAAQDPLADLQQVLYLGALLAT